MEWALLGRLDKSHGHHLASLLGDGGCDSTLYYLDCVSVFRINRGGLLCAFSFRKLL